MFNAYLKDRKRSEHYQSSMENGTKINVKIVNFQIIIWILFLHDQVIAGTIVQNCV